MALADHHEQRAEGPDDEEPVGDRHAGGGCAADQQKHTKAMTVWASGLALSSTPAAPGATKTKVFFAHCFGRAVRTRPPRSDRRGSGASRGRRSTSSRTIGDRVFRGPRFSGSHSAV